MKNRRRKIQSGIRSEKSTGVTRSIGRDFHMAQNMLIPIARRGKRVMDDHTLPPEFRPTDHPLIVEQIPLEAPLEPEPPPPAPPHADERPADPFLRRS